MKTHSQLNSEKLEHRYQDPPDLLVEERQGVETKLIRGTAVFYNQLSNELYLYRDGQTVKFREQFVPGSFDKVLNDDIVAYFNHNPDLILGRTSSGTLKVWSDEVGLHYELEVPDTTAGRDLSVSMQRKDVRHSSFSFGIEEDTWSRNDNGENIRTVNLTKLLVDVSPVVRPAYPQTLSQLAQRSLDSFLTELNKPTEEARAIALETDILEAELNLRKLIL